MPAQFVDFNVSGSRFTTLKDTVLKEPSSRLALMVREVLPVQRDAQGAIFIDRDAKFFQLVLNFLRDGWCSVPAHPDERKELLQEARFYQLLGLEAWLQNQDIAMSPPLKPRSDGPSHQMQLPQHNSPLPSPPYARLAGPSTPGAGSDPSTGASSSSSPWGSPSHMDSAPSAWAAAQAAAGSPISMYAGQGGYAGTLVGSPAFQRATQALAAAQAALATGPGLGSRPGTARPLSFMASAAAEYVPSSGGAAMPASAPPQLSSPSTSPWLPTPTVDEFRWTTKYLRSNQRLQEVVTTLLELTAVPPHRSWHAGRVTIRFAAECCHDGLTTPVYGRPLSVQPQAYQVVQVSGSSGWSFEFALRPGSDQALFDKYAIVDCIQDNWFVLTAVLKDQYGIVLEEDGTALPPKCAACRRSNITLVLQKQY